MIPLARPILEGNEKKYLMECMDSGFVTHAGRFEREFEDAFSKIVGKPSLATSSGTGALHLALLSLGVGHGDEVIVPDLTFGATASVVLAVGARPVIVDINPETFGLDQRLVLKSLTRRTRAIIPVHLYGEDAGDFTQFGILRMPVSPWAWFRYADGSRLTASTETKPSQRAKAGCSVVSLATRRSGEMADSTQSTETFSQDSTIACPICRRQLVSRNLSVSTPCYQIDCGTLVCMLEASPEEVNGYSLLTPTTP